jgi:ABC-type multidrug transport system ATPase subunit
VIPTIVSGLISNLQFWKYLGFNGPSKTRTILNDVSGFVKDGEMLLALGRPGAGCTTLLKIIANIRSSFTAIHGDVSYGGIDHKSFARYYRGQTCYNSEEDLHYPTLTAKQTLQFALRTKTPGTRLPDETRKDFSNKLLYLLGNMLGLTKQMDTMVGNAFVRGLSGGERKRLSIAEQMTTQSTINCWDCSTRGLDAASALDYVKSLRIMTDIFKKTTAVTLYQASDNIYNIFDKVILLDEGYTLYFGPVSKAKDYFVQLGFYCPPRKSTPDFLTGISNPLERQIRPGFEDSAPKHASEFQKRFQQSDIYKIMMEELAHVENQFDSEKSDEAFRKAMDEEHQKYAPNKSPFVASFLQQVIALTIRQYQLQIKDIESLCSRYGTIVVQALIMGSCFYNLPLDGSGAISRGGAIFFSVIFNSLVCQTELVNFLTGRPILEKHKQYALYRPSAFYLAQVIMDVPFALIQGMFFFFFFFFFKKKKLVYSTNLFYIVMLFEICCYFLLGLNLTAGRFFAFFIINVMINLTMNQFFRLFGAITDNVFFSSQASGLILVCSHVLCGYVIPYKSMHPWVGW